MSKTESFDLSWPAAARRAWSVDLSPLVPWIILGITLVLVLSPIVPILYQAVLDKALYEPTAKFTLDNITNLLTDNAFRAALLNSVIFTIGTTLLAQVLGMGVAVLAGRTNIIGKAVLTGLIVWPLFVSDLVKSVGFSIAYGPAGYITSLVGMLGLPTWNLNSMLGMIVVGGVSQAPITYLYCIAAVRGMDSSLEDAARAAGASPATALWRISLPLLFPAFMTSAFISIIANIEGLSIPLVFGKPSGIVLLPTYLYLNGAQSVRPDYGMLAAAALFILVLLVLLMIVQRRVLGDIRRFVTIGGKASRQKALALGALRIPLSIAVLFVMFALIGIPLLGVVLYSFSSYFSPLVPITSVLTLKNFRELTNDPAILRALVNSMIVAVVGGAIATIFVFLISTVVNRTKHRAARLLDLLTMIPRAVPGLIAGLGFFYASVVVPGFGWTRGTLVILIIVFTMRHLPLGYGAITPNLMQIDSGLESSARAAGATWIRTVRSILMPIAKPALLATFAIFFLQFLKEYSAAVFLVSPRTEIIGTVMLNLIWESRMGQVAALALIQVLIAAVSLGILSLFTRIRLYD